MGRMKIPRMSDTSNTLIVEWLSVGGMRAHAFTPGDRRYAYCTIGPGEPDRPAPDARCKTCERRIARIVAQDADLDRLLA